ncbi:T9SS type B sorting domain-containing protein [Flagellimonas sp. DF-77]|uniref:T9SS type B sorting domain-containing protein n=1 Tax=Flagellimonas algarum TaxID=3230298 RepID=UPI0033968DF6
MPLKLRLPYIACLLLAFGQGHAQLEASIWYFGNNAGLDFRSGTPVPLFDGEVITVEGSATIADPSGNLLFYTDGSTVWNRNHDVMPNGEDLFGCASATNSGIIVPAPGQVGIFYVFSAGCIGFNLGTHFSVVDLGLDGGLGDVTTKNTPLVIPATEKLTAVQHANGIDYWVVARDLRRSYYAYRVGPGGVDTTPVISTLGYDLTPFDDLSNTSAGTFKFSPDGTKAAISYVDGIFEWLDFDANTGVFSNARNVFSTNTVPKPYGVEFSPSGRLLYLTDFGDTIYQFDTENPTADPILLLAQDPDQPEFGAMQLGIDGKIYIAHFFGEYLSVIDDPEALGPACDLRHQSLFLGGRLSQLGLPPFIQSFFFVGRIEAENLCFGETTQFRIELSDAAATINWDFGDGTTATGADPIHVYTAPGTYTVTVEISTPTETTTETSQVTISEVPVAQTASSVEVCSHTPVFPLDLASKDVEVLGSQDPSRFRVDYFGSQADADAFTNPLVTDQPFGYGTTTIVARISSIANNRCYDTSSFEVLIKELPIPSAIPDRLVVCDDNSVGRFTFDLTEMRELLLANEIPRRSEVSFHPSQADADADTNALGDFYENALSVETLVFRMQNPMHPECYETGELRLEVIDQVIAHPPPDIERCDVDNDGQEMFDLTEVEGEILGAQDPSRVMVSYHLSMNDAERNTNAIPNAEYVASSSGETIHVRVTNSNNADCFATTFFQVRAFSIPELPELPDWQVCDDDNDGRFLFDLSEKRQDLSGGRGDVSISFFESQADAESDQNALPDDYTNQQERQPIYVRIANTARSECFVWGTFELQVFNTPEAFTPSDIVVCDEAGTGSFTFDLSEKDPELLQGQHPAKLSVSYHATELDALNNSDPLPKSSYRNTAASETLWARVTQKEADFCYAVVPFALFINPLPKPALETTYVICPDAPELEIDPGVFETYEWRDADGVIISSDHVVSITTIGTYTLTVSESTNGLSCSYTEGFEVLSSGAPERFTVSTGGLSDEVILTVNAVGIGDFEYSIDGSTYQLDNVFAVFPGEYTVYVRDPLGCRILVQDVVAMGYPRFFTPNNDGNNDFWNIIGAEGSSAARLFIYDRYGKLLRQLDVEGAGWDGNYAGRQMPASDYWFRYEYDNGKVFSGHFALKR